MGGSLLDWQRASRATELKGTTIELSEAQFQSQIIDLCKTLHWMVYHTHDSRKSAAGFPDLVLVRERIIFAELKRDKNKKVEEEQITWLLSIKKAGGECYLWRPKDWNSIVKVLSERRPALANGLEQLAVPGLDLVAKK